ncbi:MAG: hypothetical protein ACYTAO_13615 [Planctomycetota bacterium]
MIPDSLFNEGIESAIRQVARDCNLLPAEWKLALVSGQYKYALAENVDRIREVFFIDSDGTFQPLEYMALDNYISWDDPTDTATEPIYYSYPHYQTHVFQFQVNAPPDQDYIADGKSWVTTEAIRTLIDSGANFGRTLSGRRIRPRCVVQNLTDDSYGFIEILDMTTAKESGTATSGTTTDTLEQTGKDFDAANVAVGDIICTPSTGKVLAYAFVIEVGTTTMRYADIEGQDANGETIKRFESGDSYKVGTATEIRLWSGVPVPAGTRVAHAGWNHPGLRQGAGCDFTVGDPKATITGTTFTNTTVTGSATTGSESGDVAIASGGSHGTVSGVDDNELTVDKWIGGLPTDGETVTVKECDQYQIEDAFATERQIWIGPPASSGDGVGSESIHMFGNRVPRMPQEDDDPLEIPEHYEQAMIACTKWQVADLAGIYTPAEVASYRTLYEVEMLPLSGDVFRPPMNKPISPFRNRVRRGVRHGRRDQTRNGLRWNL